MDFRVFILTLTIFNTIPGANAETAPPLKPAPQHKIFEGKVEYAQSESPCPQASSQNPVLPQSQIETESRVTQSVFQVQFQQAHEPFYEVSATAFQIAPDLVVTNRHVLEQLMGASALRDSAAKEDQDRLVHRMQFYSSMTGLTFSPEKLLYCSATVDFCILKLAHQRNGISAGLSFPSLKLKNAEATKKSSKTNPTIVGIVGNMNGNGIQVASDRVIGIQSTGLILHCVPTSAHDSGGNSGSPIFDQNGDVIGIDTYSLALDSGCKGRNRSTGGGISSELLLNDLKQNDTDLYHAVTAN